MSQPSGETITDLLDADRELSDAEMARLHLASKEGWADLYDQLRAHARSAYRVADAADFERCVTQHMDASDWQDMVVSGVFECPRCSRLLKDRGTPVAAAILTERRRIRALWAQVEAAGPDQRDAALVQFRRGLGSV